MKFKSTYDELLYVRGLLDDAWDLLDECNLSGTEYTKEIEQYLENKGEL